MCVCVCVLCYNDDVIAYDLKVIKKFVVMIVIANLFVLLQLLY